MSRAQNVLRERDREIRRVRTQKVSPARLSKPHAPALLHQAFPRRESPHPLLVRQVAGAPGRTEDCQPLHPRWMTRREHDPDEAPEGAPCDRRRFDLQRIEEARKRIRIPAA